MKDEISEYVMKWELLVLICMTVKRIAWNVEYGIKSFYLLFQKW
jgi:hypothetical protein